MIVTITKKKNSENHKNATKDNDEQRVNNKS